MRKVLIFLTILFSFSKGQEDIATWLERQVSSAGSVEAEFIQKTYQVGSKTPEKFSGRFVASKPFVIKVEYDKPFEQTIFITKEKIVLYSPAEKQAVITKKDPNLFIEDLIAVFLNTKPLKSVFDVQTDGKGKVILKPKNNPDIREIEIFIKNETIQSTTATDNEGNKFELEFKSFKLLQKRQLITFEIPKDTKIINY